MAGANGHRIVAAIDDVVQELRYTRWAGFCWRQVKGKVAPAQDLALENGWLEPGVDRRRLFLTASGKVELDRRQQHA